MYSIVLTTYTVYLVDCIAAVVEATESPEIHMIRSPIVIENRESRLRILARNLVDIVNHRILNKLPSWGHPTHTPTKKVK